MKSNPFAKEEVYAWTDFQRQKKKRRKKEKNRPHRHYRKNSKIKWATKDDGRVYL